MTTRFASGLFGDGAPLHAPRPPPLLIFPASTTAVGTCTRMYPWTCRDTEKIRLDLEKGLSEEFKSLRRENEVLRRERAHKDSEVLLCGVVCSQENVNLPSTPLSCSRDWGTRQ